MSEKDLFEEEKTQGIVLRSIDYKDKQKIVTLFAQDLGVISLIVKGISSRNYSLLSFTTPFSEVEVVFRRGRSDLFRYVDGTVLNENLSLRERYSFLQTAGCLVQAILRSQLPGKSSPLLYQLFCSFFKQIPSFKNPDVLLCSFWLKLLRHEGLLALSSECCRCHLPSVHLLFDGESVCSSHADAQGMKFSEGDWKKLIALESLQQFSALRNFHIDPEFFKAIEGYFFSRFDRF